jgi:hypothetical protein
MDEVHESAPELEPRHGEISVFLAFATLLITWFLLWRIQSIPLSCALAYPCPRPDARVHPALLYGGLMIVPLVAIITARVSMPTIYRRVVVRASCAAMILLALIGIAAALFAGGFTFGLQPR